MGILISFIVQFCICLNIKFKSFYISQDFKNKKITRPFQKPILFD